MTNPTLPTEEVAPPAEAASQVLYSKPSVQALIEEGFPINDPLKLKLPKGVTKTEKLARKSGVYIVPEKGSFYYFKIAPPISQGSYLYKFEPPLKIKKEGFVYVDKEFFYVTLGDSERGIIRKSRQVSIKKNNVTYEDFVNDTYHPHSRTAPSGTGAKARGEGGALSDFLLPSSDFGSTNQRGSSDKALLDECKAADLAFEEQEQSLYHLILEKEGGWGEGEVEEVT